MLTLTPEARRRILGPKPRIGNVYLCDRENGLRSNPNYPSPSELPFGITSHKAEPPIVLQVALGLLISFAFLLACFL